MVKKDENKSCCAPSDMSYCKVESVITVDERGQMVLPREIREKAKIHSGDKLAVINWEKDGEVYCISLIKVEKLAEIVKGMLGPVLLDGKWAIEKLINRMICWHGLAAVPHLCNPVTRKRNRCTVAMPPRQVCEWAFQFWL